MLLVPYQKLITMTNTAFLPSKRLWRILLAVPVLLLVPFVAMQFTHEVSWTVSDFVAAAVLLLGAGLGFEILMRLFKTPKIRLAAVAVLLLAFTLLWVELAVGIFGSPISGS